MVLELGFGNQVIQTNINIGPRVPNVDRDTNAFLQNFFLNSRVDFGPNDVNNVSRDIGLSNWYKYRLFISNLLRRYKEIRLNDLSSYFSSHFSFFGFNVDEYYKSQKYLKHRVSMIVYDPDLDNSDFTNDKRDLRYGVDQNWFNLYGQDLFDQNSYNFREILQFLSDLKSKYYIPNFDLDESTIIRNPNRISSSDERVDIGWSDELGLHAKKRLIDAIYLLCVLMIAGIVKEKLFGSVCNIVIENLIRIDIVIDVGGYVKVFLHGVKTVSTLIAKAIKRSPNSVKFIISLFKKTLKGRERQPKALPEWRKLLPAEKARRALPPSRPG